MKLYNNVARYQSVTMRAGREWKGNPSALLNSFDQRPTIHGKHYPEKHGVVSVARKWSKNFGEPSPNFVAIEN